MNEAIARKLYLMIQGRRGERAPGALAELLETQYRDTDAMIRGQWDALMKLVSRAYSNVNYYKRLFDSAGLKPSKIRAPADFSRIPVLTKDIIRKEFLALHEAGGDSKAFTRIQSSGSTGEPCTADIENSCMGYFHAAQHRGFSWYGISPGDRGIKLWGVPLDLRQRLLEKAKDIALNRARFSAFDMSEEKMAALYKKCLSWKPRYIYGYASAVAHFVGFLKANKLETGNLGLKAVFTTSEILYPHQRSLIESVFPCPLANEYGSAEMGIIAFECPEHTMHISAENVYLETTGAGEVIITNLRNTLMPFIRYALNDLAVLGDAKCACGRTLPALNSIEGRSNDVLTTRKGTVLHGEFFAYLNRLLTSRGLGISEFQIIQKTHSLLQAVIAGRDKASVPAFVSLLKESTKRVLGEDMEVEVSLVDRIAPEKNGKIRYFRSQIK